MLNVNAKCFLYLPKKAGDDSQNRKPIEAEIANTFRQFAMVEKDKLNAKKQALQKKEKDGRLADLMKFHQTFKLNVPVPPDLVPLLSKTKKSPSDSEDSPKLEETSIEVEKKVAETEQKQAKESVKVSPVAEPAAKATEKPVSTPTAKANTDTTKPATETKPKSTSSFKFNVKASEFKPNPSAPAFVPVSELIYVLRMRELINNILRMIGKCCQNN
jgi:hypothetical protein